MEKTDNEIIAEFQGLTIRSTSAYDYIGGGLKWEPDRNWNHLMPVVEKIYEQGHFIQSTWESGEVIVIICLQRRGR